MVIYQNILCREKSYTFFYLCLALFFAIKTNFECALIHIFFKNNRRPKIDPCGGNSVVLGNY